MDLAWAPGYVHLIQTSETSGEIPSLSRGTRGWPVGSLLSHREPSVLQRLLIWSSDKTFYLSCSPSAVDGYSIQELRHRYSFMRVAASRVNKTAAATSPHIHWPPGNLVIACLLLVTANTALLIAALQRPVITSILTYRVSCTQGDRSSICYYLKQCHILYLSNGHGRS